jgi:hypothetical protein
MNQAFASVCLLVWALSGAAASKVTLVPAAEPAGYMARLLINETPFPGERGYVSEEDSKATMRALLLVIDARRNLIPPGYSREEVADTDSTNPLDIITAGTRRRQMDGFYRGANQQLAMAPRVAARVTRLLKIAHQGEPDRFARLLAYAQTLVNEYLAGIKPVPDPFESITRIPPQAVTGRAYAWMSDQDCYHPGGDYVRIPDRLCGRLGGNRFYTLAKRNSSK